MVRKRKPESTDHWTPDCLPAAMTNEWKAWLPSPIGTDAARPSSKDDVYRQRNFVGWTMYPLGPFDNWNEVIDFAYSLAVRTNVADHPYKSGSLANDSPFPNSVFASNGDKKVEAIIAGLSPNVFASDLASYNASHLGYSRAWRHPAATDLTDQVPRDGDATGAPAKLEPQVTGKNKLTTTGYSYPLCFSSMGRHEIYTRTYTFVKAEGGTAVPFTVPEKTTNPGDPRKDYRNYMHLLRDTGKRWFSTPCQWRGYTVAIYAGTGKGQMRGIVFVRNDLDPASDNKGCTLVTARWGVEPQSDSRYYIVGPGAFLDRPPATTEVTIIPNPVDATRSHMLQDSKAAWENDQWNGHRIVVYTGTVAAGVETIDEASIQERTIIATAKTGSPGGRLMVAPDLDQTLLAPGHNVGYIILGCDGVVEHGGAIKAYDVVHHTTQKDFETSRPTTVLDGNCTYAATGPVNFRKAASPYAQVGATVLPSRIDGWIAARRKPATGSGDALVHNFDTADLTPDSGGAYHASEPAAAEIVKDCLEYTNGRFLSDGIRLSGGTAKFVDFRLNSDLSTSSWKEGGFVSFWFRPDEAFFTPGSVRTIVEIVGDAPGTEKIALVTKDGGAGKRVLELQVTATKDRLYKPPNPIFLITDPNHVVGKPDVSFKTPNTPSHQDATYSVIYDTGTAVGWRPGEWHHIAFAWHECANDEVSANNNLASYNTDGIPTTDWRDDDTTGAGGKPNYKLDDEVACRLRIWADGNSSAIPATIPNDNEKPAFNFANSAGTAMVRLSGEAAGTIDGLVVYRHTNTNLDIAFTPLPARYDGYSGSLASAKHSEYLSREIPITNTGGDLITLGTISFTGFFPWIKDTERWGGASSSTDDFPIRVQAALGSTWSWSIPREGGPLDDPTPDPRFGYPSVLGGGPLVKTDKTRITANASTTLQYKVLLHTGHGSDAGDNTPGLLKGRQTPVVEDVTVTYLGPVVFYYWK